MSDALRARVGFQINVDYQHLFGITFAMDFLRGFDNVYFIVRGNKLHTLNEKLYLK